MTKETLLRYTRTCPLTLPGRPPIPNSHMTLDALNPQVRADTNALQITRLGPVCQATPAGISSRGHKSHTLRLTRPTQASHTSSTQTVTFRKLRSVSCMLRRGIYSVHVFRSNSLSVSTITFSMCLSSRVGLSLSSPSLLFYGYPAFFRLPSSRMQWYSFHRLFIAHDCIKPLIYRSGQST